MGRVKKTVFIVFITTILLNVMISSQPTNFDYGKHGADWTGNCTANKNQQSPIILPRENITSQKKSYFFADFKDTQSSATIFNTTVYIKPKDDDNSFGQIYSQLIDGDNVPFKALQIRIRTRSEHRIKDQNGYYDLQVQISGKQLFQSSKNLKLSIGLLFQAKDEYKDDPFLAAIIANSQQINKPFDLNVNLNHLLSRDKIFNFWFYKGSITIPPCSNGKVDWIIPDKIYQMSKTQLNFFQDKFKPNGNWRDVQKDEGNQIGYAAALPSSSQL